MLPSFLGFFVFVALAVFMSLGISFSEWGLTGFKSFVGLQNYQQLLRDQLFWQAVWNTAFLHRHHRPLATGPRAGHGAGAQPGAARPAWATG